MENPSGPALHQPILEWGYAGRAFPGEPESGDMHLVEPFAGGYLLAAVDGLGHGPRAAYAARLAVATLGAHASLPVDEALRRCHQALRGTRGVALALVRLDLVLRSLEWIAVGNVDAAVVRESGGKTERVLLRGGVVGSKLPPLRSSTVAISSGDLLVLATDGVASHFADDLRATPPQEASDRILEKFGRDTDDALVLAARLQAGP